MRLLASTLAAGLILSAACSDSSPGPTGNPNTDGPVKATINGTAWSSSTGISAVRAAGGLYTITAFNLGGDYTLSFTLYNIGAAGTFPLGTGPQMFGGNVVVSKVGSSGWTTPLNGAAGQIVITTLTASRIAGTFAFTANPSSGTAALNVTNGTFDLPITGVAFSALPDNVGSRYTGTIGGVAFAASVATHVVSSGSTPTLTIVASNIERNITLSLANVSAAGTYALSATTPVRSLQITGSPTSQTATWASQLSGGSGSVSITTFSASRITGTYTATLVPLGGSATGNLTVTGSFDIGRAIPGL